MDEPSDEALIKWIVEGSRLGSGFPYKETFLELFGTRSSTVKDAPKVVVTEVAPTKLSSEINIRVQPKEDKEREPINRGTQS